MYIYDKEKGNVAKHTVEVKQMCLDGTAVVGGLQSGQQVVATGVRHLVDGQKVKAVEKPSETNIGGLL